MYKAIEFQENQKGLGVLTDNKMTGNKALFGIFPSTEKACEFIEGDLKNKDAYSLHVHPQIVEWNKEQYEAVDYVFTTV